jgi:hypothetical protein
VIDTDSTRCVVSGGTQPGLVNNSCTTTGADGSSTYTGQLSTAVLSTDADPAATFRGVVRTGDAENADDTSGAAPFDELDDHFNFATVGRAWGRDIAVGADPFSQSAAGRCYPGETCRIFDWGLRAGDTGDDGAAVLLGVVPMPGNTDSRVHRWYAPDQAACDLIAGAHWSGTACSSTFLPGAIEVFFDGAGNDNALCEAGETCLVTPNIGAYQGHGALVSRGSTSSTAAVPNVQLVGHAMNGM